MLARAQALATSVSASGSGRRASALRGSREDCLKIPLQTCLMMKHELMLPLRSVLHQIVEPLPGPLVYMHTCIGPIAAQSLTLDLGQGSWSSRSIACSSGGSEAVITCVYPSARLPQLHNFETPAVAIAGATKKSQMIFHKTAKRFAG